MRSPFAVDGDARVIILKMLRRYPHYISMLNEARDAAIYPAARSMMTSGGAPVDMTFSAAERRERIDTSLQARIVRAIDDARMRIGADLVPEEAEKLARAVWLSCTEPDVYTFDCFAGLIPCERTKFFRYKSEFIYNIQRALGL